MDYQRGKPPLRLSQRPALPHGLLMDTRRSKGHVEKMEVFDVRPPNQTGGKNFRAATSKKIVLAREMNANRTCCLIGQPTGGVESVRQFITTDCRPAGIRQAILLGSVGAWQEFWR